MRTELYHVDLSEQLTQADCAALGQLHCDTLPRSIPALLGTAYAAKFYSAVAGSDVEFVVTVRDQDRTLIGGGLASARPRDIGARVLRLTAFSLVVGVVRTLLVGPAWKRVAILQAFFSPPEPPNDAAMILIYLFVKQGDRERGTGRMIVDAFERIMNQTDLRVLRVMTEDNEDNPALEFYTRLGFSRQQRLSHGGHTFVVLQRASGDATPDRDASMVRGH